MPRDDSPPDPPAGEGLAEVPFEHVLIATRAGDVLQIADALKSRKEEEVANALRDRDAADVVAALRIGDRAKSVEALLRTDGEKLREVRQGRDAKKVADALLSRNGTRIASALRGRDAGQVVAALASGDAGRVVDALGDREAGGSKKPLATKDADRIVSVLPNDEELGRIADDLCGRFSKTAVDPLATEEAKEIIRALDGHDVDALTRALLDRHKALWEEALTAVLPKVTAAARRRFPVNYEEAANSVALSVAKSVLRMGEKRVLQEYDLQSMDDLACVLVQIAARKCAYRMRRPAAAHLTVDLARPEMGEQVQQEIDSLHESLDCAGRVVLINKLARPRPTDREIAEMVLRECPEYKTYSTRAVQRRWEEIREEIREALSDALSDSGDE